MSRREHIVSGKAIPRSGMERDAIAKSDYHASLESELGASDGTRGYRGFHDNAGAAAGSGELLARPITIFFIAILFFGIVMLALMWREGRLGQLWESTTPVVAKAKLSASELGIYDVEEVTPAEPAWADPYAQEPPKAAPAPAAPEPEAESESAPPPTVGPPD